MWHKDIVPGFNGPPKLDFLPAAYTLIDLDCPGKVSTLGALIGVSVMVVPDTGHSLGPRYVAQVLDRWLSNPVMH